MKESSTKLYNLYEALFYNDAEEEEETIFTYKDEWYPTKQDWHTMIFAINGHKDIANSLKHIKDPNKLIRYYKIAQALGWQATDKLFEKYLEKYYTSHIIFYDEYEIIKDEIIPIPDEWTELIDELKRVDKLGGISLIDQDLGNLADDYILFDAINYVGDIIDIKFYKSDLNYYYEGMRCIKLYFNNGSVAVIKITRRNETHDIKTLYFHSDNIGKNRFRIQLAMIMYPYKEQKTVDDDWIIHYG